MHQSDFFLSLQTWADTSSPCITSHGEWLPPTTGLHPLDLGWQHVQSSGCPTAGPPRVLAAAHTVLGTLGSRSARLAHGRQPRGKHKPGWASPFLRCREPAPNPSAFLLPASLGQCQQWSPWPQVHLIQTQAHHFFSWSHLPSSSHNCRFLD